mmetsp:Transcript_92645/g.299677  ORF Transcript_92645/g.299677 Transcript_92645/m.299677 type:complete len:224 (-) Transcript_92645:237-908(-)
MRYIQHVTRNNLAEDPRHVGELGEGDHVDGVLVDRRRTPRLGERSVEVLRLVLVDEHDLLPSGQHHQHILGVVLMQHRGRPARAYPKSHRLGQDLLAQYGGGQPNVGFRLGVPVEVHDRVQLPVSLLRINLVQKLTETHLYSRPSACLAFVELGRDGFFAPMLLQVLVGPLRVRRQRLRCPADDNGHILADIAFVKRQPIGNLMQFLKRQSVRLLHHRQAMPR